MIDGKSVKSERGNALDDIKEKAEFFRIGLILGVHTVSDVVEWADSEIQHQDKPPNIFIELSLMGNSGSADVRTKLNEFPGTVDKSKVLHKILSKLLEPMYHELAQHPEYGPTLAERLYKIYLALEQEFGHFNVPRDLYPMLVLNDQYRLAQQGTYGTEQGVLQDFLTFLKPYGENPNHFF